MNSNNNSNHNKQSWMIPAGKYIVLNMQMYGEYSLYFSILSLIIDHTPETFNYMVSRPPGSVLPMLPQHQHQHQLQQQQQQQQPQQQPLSLQHPTLHQSNHQEQSVSPPAQAHEYNNSKNGKGGSRAVIPSKRAAQNRAAQKAFRQRREQYIKDLEIKAKEMEDWQDEMDKLRKENGELRERVATLENQVVVLTGGDASKIAELEKLKASSTPTPSLLTPPTIAESITRKSPERSMSLPNTRVSESEANAIRDRASPASITSSATVKRSHNESRLRHEQTTESEDNNSPTSNNIQDEAGSFTRIPLRAPNPTIGFETPSYHPTDHTPTLIGNDTTTAQQVDDINKRRKLDDPIIGQQQSTPHIGQAPISNVGNANLSNNSAANSMMHNNTNNPLLISIQQQSQEQPQMQHPTNDFWGNNNANAQHPMPDNMAPAPAGGMGDFDLDFDFDPFFEDEFGPTITSNNDFLPNANSGQVLDDLFAMLQTRQRPQIPMVPSEETTELSNANNSSNSNFNDSLGRLG